MKKFINVLFVIGMALLATSSFAGNVYISGSGGVSFLLDANSKNSILLENDVVLDSPLKTQFKRGFNAGVALGYDFGAFRTELEIAYQKFKINNIHIDLPNPFGIESIDVPLSGPVTSISFLFNNYLDFENKSSFTPYMGLGVGVARLTVDSPSTVFGYVGVDDSTTVLAYKIIAGGDLKVSSNVDLTFDYSFFGTKDPTFKDREGSDFKTDVHSHNFNAGIKYNF